SGGGLAFFVRDINYQKLNILPTGLTWRSGHQNSMEASHFDIINVYHPPNHKALPPALSNLLNKNSIIVGDLNAKHPSWGCSYSNARGGGVTSVVRRHRIYDHNDGTHTFTSYSYNTSAALDILQLLARNYFLNVLGIVGHH
ncbi:RNA-directed DNA polymerase from mobile element jockey, partial [Trichonephila clavipes]